jgi:hypothetical protein
MTNVRKDVIISTWGLALLHIDKATEVREDVVTSTRDLHPKDRFQRGKATKVRENIITLT